MAILERQIRNTTALDSAGSSTIPVLMTTGVVYTNSIDIEDAVYLGVTITGGTQTATGSGKQTIVVEQGYTTPLVEGSASSVFFTTDTAMNTTSWLAAGLSTFCPITLKGLRYVRLKSTPVTPNRSANFTAVFSMQVGG